MRNILDNMPPVVKNLLLLNVLMFIITLIGQWQGFNLTRMLGGYVFNSPFFEPYQMVTHFFMHGGFFHILFNMFALVIFGSALERVWGPKRFFIFYIICALGAFILYEFVGYIQAKGLEEQIIATGQDINDIKHQIANMPKGMGFSSQLFENYRMSLSTPVIGASGAVFGVLVAFAYLFPNTELMLLFPPIPIKAKWLVLILVGIQIYYSLNSPGDNVAHLAHVGGALVGFIIVFFWQKNTRKFY